MPFTSLPSKLSQPLLCLVRLATCYSRISDVTACMLFEAFVRACSYQLGADEFGAGLAQVPGAEKGAVTGTIREVSCAGGEFCLSFQHSLLLPGGSGKHPKWQSLHAKEGTLSLTSPPVGLEVGFSGSACISSPGSCRLRHPGLYVSTSPAQLISYRFKEYHQSCMPWTRAHDGKSRQQACSA